MKAVFDIDLTQSLIMSLLTLRFTLRTLILYYYADDLKVINSALTFPWDFGFVYQAICLVASLLDCLMGYFKLELSKTELLTLNVFSNAFLPFSTFQSRALASIPHFKRKIGIILVSSFILLSSFLMYLYVLLNTYQSKSNLHVFI